MENHADGKSQPRTELCSAHLSDDRASNFRVNDGAWRRGLPDNQRILRARCTAHNRRLNVERRDAAGRGRTVTPWVEQLDPRSARITALENWHAPTGTTEMIGDDTCQSHAPWTVTKSHELERARMKAMKWVLKSSDCEGKAKSVVGTPDPLMGSSWRVHEAGERPGRTFPTVTDPHPEGK